MRESPLVRHLLEQGSSYRTNLPGTDVAAISQIRENAFRRFSLLGLPRLTDEAWRYTNVRRLEKTTYSLATAKSADVGKIDLEDVQIPELDVFRMVFLDGWYDEELSELQGLPNGVNIRSLAEILADADSGRKLQPKFIFDNLKSASESASHGFAALNVAFAGDGAYVQLEAGVELPKPLEILCISSTGAINRLSNLNHFIEVADGAKIEIVERYISLLETSYVTNSSVSLKLASESKVDHYRIQNESEQAFHIGAASVHQQQSSKYRIFSLSFGALLSRHEVAPSLDGEKSHCDLLGLYMGRRSQHIDNYTVIAHESPNCSSNEFYKGILDDRSRAVFHGRIIVKPDSQKTDAQQQNKNLLLSRNAEADTKPQLEIYADDVKCSHGATVGQLDADAIFYLQSRGLSSEEARALLTKAFAVEVVEKIDLADLREYVFSLVDHSLSVTDQVREAA